MALTQSKEAPNSILRLSDLMRYIVSESEEKKVLLSKEIEHIKNFVALQKLRTGGNTTVHFKIKGLPENQLIAPIILINYIENAFKYGVNPDIPSEVSIEVGIDGDRVNLDVKNHIVVNRDNVGIESTKEGMRNTRKRLDILYPNKYSLAIEDTGAMYSCTLNIDLS